MNIQQLAEQAGYMDKGNNITAYRDFNHEKFAELIAKECINILSQPEYAMKCDPKTLSNYNEGWVCGRLDGIYQIKSAFNLK